MKKRGGGLCIFSRFHYPPLSGAQKSKVECMDTRSPSPRLYRLITHKFKVTPRSVTPFRMDPRYEPPRCVLHTTTQERTCQGPPPHIGVAGLVSFISVGSQRATLSAIGAAVRTFRRSFHRLSSSIILIIYFFVYVCTLGQPSEPSHRLGVFCDKQL